MNSQVQKLKLSLTFTEYTVFMLNFINYRQELSKKTGFQGV